MYWDHTWLHLLLLNSCHEVLIKSVVLFHFFIFMVDIFVVFLFYCVFIVVLTELENDKLFVGLKFSCHPVLRQYPPQACLCSAALGWQFPCCLFVYRTHPSSMDVSMYSDLNSLFTMESLSTIICEASQCGICVSRLAKDVFAVQSLPLCLPLRSCRCCKHYDG